MELKTYNISTDITGSSVDCDKLDSEIADTTHVTTYEGIVIESGEITIHGDSFNDETALDTLVLNHVVPQDVVQAIYKCADCVGVFHSKSEINEHLSDNPTHTASVSFKNKNN